LWIISFALWQNIPLAASRYSTELYPPNYVSYPYSDAGDYAIQAEAILVGKGFPYGFIDKPLHLVFLSLLGLLAGKDFALQTTLQVAVLALIPSLMYLLASKMTSRSAGIFAGITAMFMQANNLVLTNRIQMTNVKMTMSESLTCLMLLLVALTLFYWWTDQKNKVVYPALAGAVLGLSSLVRLNVIVIAPFVFLTWLIVSGIRLRGTWKSALIFLVFCILPLIPWSIRTQLFCIIPSNL
jgi:4-amino-4-deoxy-L-arabinose transferase-like glycosyltransferase